MNDFIEIENIEPNLDEKIIDNIIGPLTDFTADEDGNMTIPENYYEVNGVRMSEEEYRDWQSRRNNEFCESIGEGKNCLEDLLSDIDSKK